MPRYELNRVQSTKIAKGSLTDVARQQNRSVADVFADIDALIVVDTSGSMASNDARGEQQRHDVAQQELEKLQRKYEGKIAVVSFSSDVVFCPNGVPVRLNAGTDMAKALEYAIRVDGTRVRIILISDGDPDSKADTLRIARQFQSAIDTVFVGPEGGYGEDFLRQLAAASGGVSVRSERVAELANPVERLLLSSG